MNNIPLSLWKEVVRTKKSRALWRTCKKLGKDTGHEDPLWNFENCLFEEGVSRVYQFWDYTNNKAGQPARFMFFRVSWPKKQNHIEEANIFLYEGIQHLLTIAFLNLETLSLTPGPDIWQKLARCPKVCVSFPDIPLSQVLSQDRAEFSSFSGQEMERIIRIYQACSPVTFWFIEEMARFLHGKAKAKTIGCS